jgi:hypothetical protein
VVTTGYRHTKKQLQRRQQERDQSNRRVHEAGVLAGADPSRQDGSRCKEQCDDEPEPEMHAVRELQVAAELDGRPAAEDEVEDHKAVRVRCDPLMHAAEMRAAALATP